MSSLERRSPEPMFRPRTTYGAGVITGVAAALILPGLIAGALGFIALVIVLAAIYFVARMVLRG